MWAFMGRMAAGFPQIGGLFVHRLWKSVWKPLPPAENPSRDKPFGSSSAGNDPERGCGERGRGILTKNASHLDEET